MNLKGQDTHAMKTIVHGAGRFRFPDVLRNLCFAVAVLAVAVATCPVPVRAAESPLAPSDWRVIEREGQGSLLVLKGRKVLAVKGTPYQMGYQHGRLLGKETTEDVRAFVHEWAVGKAGLSVPELRRIFDSLRPFIPKQYMEEMRGLSEGSGVPLNEIHLLHALPTRFHCTGAAAFGKATADGRLYHTRSLDYSLDIGDRRTIQDNAIVLVYQPAEGKAHAVLSWAGFIGCVSGMNAEGISIGEMGNACRDESYSGMPMIFMLREALRTCTTLDEVMGFVGKSPRTCGFTFIVGDGKVPSARALEVSHSRMAVGLPGDEKSSPPPHFAIPSVVRRGNHFVDKEMAALQREIYDPKLSSPANWLGYSVMSDFVLENYGRLDGIKMIELLRKYPPEHPCLHQAVFSPSTLEFWVSDAVNPSAAKYAGAQNQAFYKYDLVKLIGGIPFEVKVEEAPARAAGALPPPETGGITISERKEFLSDSSLSRFRLRRKTFRWVLTFDSSRESYFVGDLSFPSEVETRWPEANTVLAEYYLPKAPGKVPAVIVLDILEGNFVVARMFAKVLAEEGIAALAMHMPFFGKREPRGDPEGRMLSGDISFAREVIRQAVLDIRCAALWLRGRKEVDPDRTGIVGVSLGAVIGALAIGVDDSFVNNALILGGGDVAEIIWTSPEGRRFKERLVEEDYTVERLREELRSVDPLTYAHRIKPGTVIMFNGKKDRTVTSACALKLWEKAGRPRIVWYNTTHLGMALHANKIMEQVAAFVRGEGASSP